MIRPEFKFHKLNAKGIQLNHDIAQRFTDLLNWLESLNPAGSPELIISKRKLEEASFYAKKSMAINPDNQAAE